MFELLGLIFLLGFFLFFRMKKILWTSVLLLYLLLFSFFSSSSIYVLGFYWVVSLGLIIAFNIPAVRFAVLTRPMFNYFKRALPPISQTEREAIDAGDTYWEADLFCGSPDWKKLHAIKKPTLNPEEQTFLDNQVETLCGMLNDWEVVQEQHDLPPSVWDYLKKEKFFGLVVEKKYGGLGFSALAHSSIVTKIATRSFSAAINTMVPNSLGPGELLHRYGTDAQKSYYLPRLANGEEIPCFGLTSLEAGSDAGSMIDEGVVCKKTIDGQEVLGINLNFSKRYITLAPVATLIGLAFKLYDPEHLLGSQIELGITLALLAANTPGVKIGNRHFPMSLAFMNGPIVGENVFVPMDAIIGGQVQIGQGWRMLMECLSIGRSISLPALSTAAGVLAYRSTGAYARLRQQFRMSIGDFEGVAEALAEIGAKAYTLVASRIFTANAVDQGCKPSVASAITKYHSTEMARIALNLAVDVHGGKAVQNGPSNYLSRAFTAMPVATTVEGANILTRNLIIFGQGVIRCHPYILSEMQAVEDNSLLQFDKLLVKHVIFAVTNVIRCLSFAFTKGRWISVPKQSIPRYYYRQLTRMSTALAMVSDLSLLILGGTLKRREALSARLGDVLSALYLSSTVIKYFQDHQRSEEDLTCVRWMLEQQLAHIQSAFDSFFDNFPYQYLARILRFIVFPFGRYRGPKVSLSQKLAKDMMTVSKFRDRLTELCYIGAPDQPLAILEDAFKLQPIVDPLFKRLQAALKARQLKPVKVISDLIDQGLAKELLSAEEAKILHEYQNLKTQALSVDEFSAKYFKSE